MIASRQLQDLTKGFGRNAFDLPVAFLAATAVAVFAFAIPGDALADAVGATGLPSILTAAEPPLGFKARAAIGLVGAIVAFALVYFVMRRLDGGKASRPAPVLEPVETFEDEEAPKLRRRDSHPDAPPRRPISAIRDLGEPAPPAEPPARAAAPSWLAEPEPQTAPVAEAEPEPEVEVEEVELVAEAPPQPEVPLEEASLPELMARLERGLAQRRDRQVFARRPEPQASPQPQVFPEANDDRLQSAIESLQRLAGRND